MKLIPNLLFYGLDANDYLSNLYKKISKRNDFSSFSIGTNLSQEDILKHKTSEIKNQHVGPSIISAEFSQYYLCIQRRLKNLELHECYNLWQINFSYFTDYLLSNQIDTIILCNCPHEDLDLCLWYAAKSLSLNVFFYWQIPLSWPKEIKGKFLLSSNINDFSDFYKLGIFKKLNQKINDNRYNSRQSIDPVKVKLKINYKLKEIIRTLKFYFFFQGFSLFKTIKYVFYIIIKKPSVLKHFKYLKESIEIISVSKKEQLNNFKPFIYFPLHQQPEISTTMISGNFNEHADIIINIANVAKKHGINLIVKENPKQTSFQRNSYFYLRLKKLQNVFFTSTSIDSSDLVKQSIGIATISGTTGIEALLENRNVFLFGNPWYKNCKSVKKILTEKDLSNYLSKNLINNQNKSYLNSFLLENSIHLCDGIIDSDYISDLSKANYEDILQETFESIISSIIKLKLNKKNI